MIRTQTSLTVLVVATVAALVPVLPAAQAAVVSVTWIEADGWWNTPGNWGPEVVPNNNGDQYEVTIDQTGAIVRLDISPTINNLVNHNDLCLYDQTLTTTAGLTNHGIIYANGGTATLVGDVNNAAGATVSVTPGSSPYTLYGSGIWSNEGEVVLVGSPWTTGDAYLVATADLGFSGSGRLHLDSYGWGSDTSLQTDPGVTISNAAGHTIDGDGHIEAALLNQGTIDANQSGQTLYLVEQDKTNSGTMTATVGTLRIEGITIDQSGGGEILADGGTVWLDAVTISGGTLLPRDGGTVWLENTTISGGPPLEAGLDGTFVIGSGAVVDNGSLTGEGTFEARDGGELRNVGLAVGVPLEIHNSATLRDMTIGSGATVEVAPPSNSPYTLYGSGTWSNEGEVMLVSSPWTTGDAYLVATADLGFSGSGRLHLDSYGWGSDTSLQTDPGVTISNAAGHTIDGDGRIEGPGTLDNFGTVEAGGGTLTVTATVPQFSDSTLTGGTWISRAGSPLDVTTGSNIVTNEGTVLLDGVGSSFNWIDALADNRAGFGVVNGRDFATGGSLSNSGTISVGNGSTLTVNGDLPMADVSQYACEIGGAGAGLIAAAGDVTLANGSTLSVEGIAPLSTWCQQTLTIMEVTDPGQYGILGEFSTLLEVGSSAENEGTYLGNGMWFGNYRTGEGLIYVGRSSPGDPATAVEITLWQAKKGDANGDRTVSFADFNDLANNYTGSLLPCQGGKDWKQGDFDGDCDVDFSDFNDLANNYTGAGVEYPCPATKVSQTQDTPVIELLVNLADGSARLLGEPAELIGYAVVSKDGLLLPDVDEAAAPWQFYLSNVPGEITAASLGTPCTFDGERLLDWRLNVDELAKGKPDLCFEYAARGHKVTSGTVRYVVPEPGTLSLLAFAAIGLLALGTRHRKRYVPGSPPLRRPQRTRPMRYP